MTQTLNVQVLTSLLEDFTPPCISIYQPTHRHYPDNEQDPIRYKNLLKRVESAIEKAFPKHPKQGKKEILEPFLKLADDEEFWNHTTDGLAVLGAPGFFRVFQFQRAMPEVATVAESFHIKPMLRILQSADRYQVLSLSRQKIKLFEGNRDALDEVALAEGVPQTLEEALGRETTEQHLTVASYGGIGPGAEMHHAHGSRKEERQVDEERFFRLVDDAIWRHHSRPSGLPLILAAPTEHQGHFRQISENSKLVAQGIDLDVNSLEIGEIREAAWKVMEPEYRARLQRLSEEFAAGRAKRMGSDRLSEIAHATVQSRVGVLLVEADRQIPGRLDRETGNMSRSAEETAGLDDLLDDLAEAVLKQGGNVVVAPGNDMPTDTGAAAIYRF